MPKNKKKWIDKKNSVTFHLVHRSQQDPLTADETAPQRVLLEAPPPKEKLKNKEEEIKYGIYYDDDYDYLQHLREAGTSVAHWEQVPSKPTKESAIQLPSSVFASEVEEDVGLLNKAAPQSGLRLDLDPDIVAAMDDDFDFENPDNQLDDDFVLTANVSGDEFLSDEDGDYMSAVEEEDEDSASSGMGGRSEDELEDSEPRRDLKDTKSRFTEFSMSSSVLPRNDQLKLLDARFEKMMEQYDDSNIGSLDFEEIEGDIDQLDDRVLRLVDEEFDERFKLPDPEPGLTAVLDTESSSSSEGYRWVPVEEKKQWDCQSILSTYSNQYNHPKLIIEPKTNKIKVSKRTGMPLAENRLTARNLASLGGLDSKGPASVISALSTLSIRNKDESPEEKKQRKKTLKEYRKERRVERKLNCEAFKKEKKRQEKSMQNARVSNIAVHL